MSCRGGWVWVLLVFVACSVQKPQSAMPPPSQPPKVSPEALIAAIKRARGRGRGPYGPWGEAREEAAFSGLSAWLRGAADAPPFGFERAPWPEPDAQLWALPQGGGAYVLRRGGTSPFVVEVPHSFSDLKTLPIGVALYLHLSARALLVSGTQRRVGCEPGARVCPADVAHTKHSGFNAVHRALVEGQPQRWVVAVHGFAERRGDPMVVLSAAGSRLALAPVARRLRAALSAYSARPVGTYPDEIGRLGGTTGTQAKHTALARARFMHLELARSLREALASSPALMHAFAAAVARPAREP